MNVHFSSKSHLWGTPQTFFDELNKIYKFNTDVCATAENAKCKHFYSPQEDGLKQFWFGTCWMNPPYGKEIKFWVKKAYESSLYGCKVVCLLPSRTDTAWWHDYVIPHGKITFIRGRLSFTNSAGSKNPAPFPSAIVVFG
jgi:phage N-6-adenine-methyltransferase